MSEEQTKQQIQIIIKALLVLFEAHGKLTLENVELLRELREALEGQRNIGRRPSFRL